MQLRIVKAEPFILSITVLTLSAYFYGCSPKTYFVKEKTAPAITGGAIMVDSPEVFIGGQAAKKIQIFPDMEGLIATFDPIKMPPQKDEFVNPTVDLAVITSHGQSVLKNVVEILPERTQP